MRFMTFLLLLFAGCTLAPQPPTPLQLQGKVVLQTDTLWQGEILIDGAVTVAHGATLTIAPGSRVRFVRRDADRDGLGDATIIVKGSLIARGTENRPILFASAHPHPAPGDWLEIRSDFAEQLLFDWCELRDSAYTLHVHFTRGHLRNSHIHHNIDGSRLGRSKFVLQHNLIEHNSGKGINFRDSEITLTDNIIRDNRAGIFLFEKPGQSVISHNDLYRNGINLQLGDFFSDDIVLADNWWGSADPQRIRASIHDSAADPDLGTVTTAAATHWLETAGIQHEAGFKPLWQVASAGFVDSPPLAAGKQVLFASWDGRLRAVDQGGKLQWQGEAGDVIDGALLENGGRVYLQDWSRKLYAFDQASGRRTELFAYPPSPADDHRQAGLARSGANLLLPAWNGTLYALRLNDLKPVWTYDAGMPLRATPLVLDRRIYVASGSGRLSVLSADGSLLWRKELGQPLLSSPVAIPGGILVLDKAGRLAAFDPAGKQLWARALHETGFYARPLVSGDGLFVATAAGRLWKLDPRNGQVVWRRQLGAAFYAPPVSCGPGILVADNDGLLQLVDGDSGRVLAQYQAGAAIQSRPLVTGNRLYFGSRDRNLHALQLVRGAVGQ